MSSRTRHPARKDFVGLIAVVIVFGLVVLMVFKRYDPAVITTVVTGTSFAAAELLRRLADARPTIRSADKGEGES